MPASGTNRKLLSETPVSGFLPKANILYQALHVRCGDLVSQGSFYYGSKARIDLGAYSTGTRHASKMSDTYPKEQGGNIEGILRGVTPEQMAVASSSLNDGSKLMDLSGFLLLEMSLAVVRVEPPTRMSTLESRCSNRSRGPGKTP